MRGIVTSSLPHWERTRLWILSRPLSGFSETFSQYIMEVEPGGGSDMPDPDEAAEGALFVVAGELTVDIGERSHVMQPGGFALMCRRAAAGRRATTAPSGRSFSIGSARPTSSSTGWRRPSRWSPMNG